MVLPCDMVRTKAYDVYAQLIALRTKFPIGTVHEVVDWKNEAANDSS